MPAKRNLELIMLLFTFGVYAFALAQVQLATIQVLSPEGWFFWGLPVLIATGFHIVLRLKASDADPLLLPIGFFLNSLGIVMIYRLDLAKPLTDMDRTVGVRQVIWMTTAMLIAGAILWGVKNHLSLRKYLSLIHI